MKEADHAETDHSTRHRSPKLFGAMFLSVGLIDMLIIEGFPGPMR